MSQSPETAEPVAGTLPAYRRGWSALSQLIGEGRSFSGYERNCAFLNVRGQRFADVSACSGLDLIDDGRSLAVCDWDFDGRLDFWLTNRTAPRVRLLRNASSPGSNPPPHFAAFLLRGTRSNRDAVGARVALHFRDPQPPLIRTVRAGDGFLGQSTRWIHFGLGERADPARIEVRWPGGAAEGFDVPAPDRFYLAVEGAGHLEEWTPPKGATSIPAYEAPSPSPSKESATRRTWIVGRTPFPAVRWLDFKGAEHALPDTAAAPLLVNLWSVTCRPCVAELEEWKERHDELTHAGIRVLTLCVDNIQKADPELLRQAETFIRQLAPPFAHGLASPDLVEAMEIVHRAYIELQLPLPVPTSFLLDDRGRTTAIYKGRVAVEQLITDARLLSEPFPEQRLSALPFPGRMASLPFPPDPARIASGYLAAGKPAGGAAYLQQALTNPAAWLEGQHAPDNGAPIVAECASLAGEILLELGRPQDAAKAWSRLLTTSGSEARTHRLAGERLLQQNLAAEALPHLERALAGEPGEAGAALRFNLGLAQLGAGQPAKAVENFRAALAIEPNDLPCLFQLGNALLAAGDPAPAVKAFREALRIEPGWPYASRQLAWVLATDADPAIRNGSEAVTLAREACSSTSFRDPAALHLLAAALAETGEFAAAIETADRALALLEGNAAGIQLSAQIRQARSRYEQGEPLRRSR